MCGSTRRNVFIESHLDEPFFACITTNAPHEPYLVEEKYAARTGKMRISSIRNFTA